MARAGRHVFPKHVSMVMPAVPSEVGNKLISLRFIVVIVLIVIFIIINIDISTCWSMPQVSLVLSQLQTNAYCDL